MVIVAVVTRLRN